VELDVAFVIYVVPNLQPVWVESVYLRLCEDWRVLLSARLHLVWNYADDCERDLFGEELCSRGKCFVCVRNIEDWKLALCFGRHENRVFDFDSRLLEVWKLSLDLRSIKVGLICFGA
jgi:hypothetical protein